MKAIIMLIASTIVEHENVTSSIDSVDVPALLTKYIDIIESKVLEVSNFMSTHELHAHLGKDEVCLEIANSINSITKNVTLY